MVKGQGFELEAIFWVKCPTPGPYGCIHLNKNREEKNRHHATFSSAAILHMCIKNTHRSRPPSLVTNLPGNAAVNRLVTRSFLSASNPKWHPSSEEIQKSPPRDLAIIRSPHHGPTSFFKSPTFACPPPPPPPTPSRPTLIGA